MTARYAVPDNPKDEAAGKAAFHRESAEGRIVAPDGAAQAAPAPVTAEAQPSARGQGASASVGTFTSLRFRDFRNLWIGTIFSSVGQWLQQVTLGWVIYDLTGSGTLLGSLNGMRALAMLSFGPMTGVFIDRLDRRALLLWNSLALLAASAVVGVLLLLDLAQVWHLFAFMFFFGLIQAFDQPLRSTVIFDVLPRSHMPNAVALNTAAFSITRALGPGVGGYIIAWIGASGNFFVQAGAYLISAVTRFFVRIPPRQPRARHSARQDFMAGLRFVLSQPATRTYALISMIAPLLLLPIFNALSPIYAKDVFHRGPEVLGFIVGVVGFGGVIGALFTASLGRYERRGLIQIVALLVFALSQFAYSYSPSLWVALPLLALAGCGEMVFMTTNQTLLQLTVPNELRGRVTSILLLTFGVMPVGALIAGVGADLIGVREITRVMSGAAALIAVAIFVGSPTVRNMRLSDLIGSAPVRGAAPPRGH